MFKSRRRSRDEDFSATTPREKLHQRNCQAGLRIWIQILPVALDDIDGAVNDLLAVSALPNLIRSADQASEVR
jgi:hypothetical protein